MPNTFWQVAPRYTAGSPGQVDATTAKRIATAELSCYSIALAGTNGPAEQARAERLGISGVVESVTDWADGRRVITDQITGVSRQEPIDGPTKAAALAADLKILADLIDRRGGDWIRKWASLQDVRQAVQDPAYVAYIEELGHAPDPRD